MSLLVVVAHCDDETIGASQTLFRHRHDCGVIHVTDSAPRDLSYARRAGFTTRREYANARRMEMYAALRVIGLSHEQCHTMEIADQDAPRQIPRITKLIRDFLTRQTTRVLTHAYEGGHPDHDACALAVHRAVEGLKRVELFEMPFYHAAPGTRVAGEFIPHADAGDVIAPPLPKAAIARKRKMFRRFVTQAHVFDRFPIEREPMRRAPHYDFSQPPHPGTLYYETRPLGWTWQRWREATR